MIGQKKGKNGTQNIMQHIPVPGAGGSIVIETLLAIVDSSLRVTTRPLKGFQPDAHTPLESSFLQDSAGVATSSMTGGSNPDMSFR